VTSALPDAVLQYNASANRLATIARPRQTAWGLPDLLRPAKAVGRGQASQVAGKSLKTVSNLQILHTKASFSAGGRLAKP